MIHRQVVQTLSKLNPAHFELENESINHAGYFEGKESHFKLTIVSEKFAGKRLVARHQLVYDAVSHLLKAQGGTIHALAIHAYTPEEWQTILQNKGAAPNSPNCASKLPNN